MITMNMEQFSSTVFFPSSPLHTASGETKRQSFPTSSSYSSSASSAVVVSDNNSETSKIPTNSPTTKPNVSNGMLTVAIKRATEDSRPNLPRRCTDNDSRPSFPCRRENSCNSTNSQPYLPRRETSNNEAVMNELIHSASTISIAKRQHSNRCAGSLVRLRPIRTTGNICNMSNANIAFQSGKNFAWNDAKERSTTTASSTINSKNFRWSNNSNNINDGKNKFSPLSSMLLLTRAKKDRAPNKPLLSPKKDSPPCNPRGTTSDAAKATARLLCMLDNYNNNNNNHLRLKQEQQPKQVQRQTSSSEHSTLTKDKGDEPKPQLFRTPAITLSLSTSQATTTRDVAPKSPAKRRMSLSKDLPPRNPAYLRKVSVKKLKLTINDESESSCGDDHHAFLQPASGAAAPTSSSTSSCNDKPACLNGARLLAAQEKTWNAVQRDDYKLTDCKSCFSELCSRKGAAKVLCPLCWTTTVANERSCSSSSVFTTASSSPASMMLSSTSSLPVYPSTATTALTNNYVDVGLTLDNLKQWEQKQQEQQQS